MVELCCAGQGARVEVFCQIRGHDRGRCEGNGEGSAAEGNGAVRGGISMDFAIVGQGIGDIGRIENRWNELFDSLKNVENAVKEIVRMLREVYEKIERAVDEVMIEWERRRKTRRYMALKVLSVYTETDMLDIRRLLRRIYRARSCC